MHYFSDFAVSNDLFRTKIFERRSRSTIPGLSEALCIVAGDILEVFFLVTGLVYVFEGLCLSVRKRGYLNPNMAFFLRNYMQEIGIECRFCFYYDRSYFLRIHDFKRKFYGFSRAKLFFLKQHLLRVKEKI